MSSDSNNKPLLKGNFKPAKEVQAPAAEATLEDQFEREALKRLGGSVAFVARRKVVWDMSKTTEDTATPDKKDN